MGGVSEMSKIAFSEELKLAHNTLRFMKACDTPIMGELPYPYNLSYEQIPHSVLKILSECVAKELSREGFTEEEVKHYIKTSTINEGIHSFKNILNTTLAQVMRRTVPKIFMFLNLEINDDQPIIKDVFKND